MKQKTIFILISMLILILGYNGFSNNDENNNSEINNDELSIENTDKEPSKPSEEDIEKSKILKIEPEISYINEYTKKDNDSKKKLFTSPRVVIKTTYGEIVIGFFKNAAPKHVESFVKLAKEGFYDGTIFHRVIPGFMIQGGDPITKDVNRISEYGTGGPDYNLDAEFNSISHDRGILSMARSAKPNSAGSQFFIMHKHSNFLNYKYTVFGAVIKGMNVVDKIAQVKRNIKDLPYKRIEMTMKVYEDEKYNIEIPKYPIKRYNEKNVFNLKPELKYIENYTLIDDSKSKLKLFTNKYAVISTKYGDIVIAFFDNAAPKHVDNFITLAENKFYDGTIFHRVIPNFMIQGGDPITKNKYKKEVYGTGGPGYSINEEFNAISHRRGIVSMARSQDPNSAGSQFFIMHANSPFLDEQYTVFGAVIKGLDVIDRIADLKRNSRDLPHKRVEITVKIYKK